MTEAQIAAEFGASRRVAREAVSRLRAFDLLRSRRRKGLVVGQANPVGLFSGSMQFFGRNPANIRDLAILRYTIEVGAVDLAVANITDTQVAQMLGIARDYDVLVREGFGVKGDSRAAAKQKKSPVKHHEGSTLPEHIVAALDQADYLFHRSILDATASPLIGGMHQVLMDYFRITREKMITAPPAAAHMLDVAADHLAIAEAFATRDSDVASKRLKLHLATIVEGTGLRVP